MDLVHSVGKYNNRAIYLLFFSENSDQVNNKNHLLKKTVINL